MTSTQLLGWGIGIGAAVVCLWLLKSVLVPFLIAFLLAYAFNPVVGRMSRWIPRQGAIALLFFLILLILVLILLYVIPVMEKQISLAVQKIPVYFEVFRTEALPAIEHTFGIYIPKTVEEAFGAVLPRIRSMSPDLFRPITSVVVQIFSNTFVLIIWMVNLVIIPFALYYFLKDFDRIQAGVTEIIPPSYRRDVGSIMREIDLSLSGFIHGQLLIVLILTVLYSLALWVIGVELSVILGTLAGVMELIPYAGFFVGLGLSLLMTSLQFQDFLHPFYVVAAFSAIQFVQGFFILPRVIGRHVGLHPLVVIAALYVGGDLFGFVGLLLAVPGAAILVVLLKYLVRTVKASSVYGTPPAGESG